MCRARAAHALSPSYLPVDLLLLQRLHHFVNLSKEFLDHGAGVIGAPALSIDLIKAELGESVM